MMYLQTVMLVVQQNTLGKLAEHECFTEQNLKNPGIV